MGNWLPSRMSSTVFANVQLVGHPDGEYHVLVEEGVVKQISKSRISGASEVIDCKDKWLAPVSLTLYFQADM
jgi:dihydroorotase-like cyclic amidohydrolase